MIRLDLKHKILSADRVTKQFIIIFTDLFLISLATLGGLYFSLNSLIGTSLYSFTHMAVIPLLSILIFSAMGVYRSVVRYINFSFIYMLLKSILLLFFISWLIQTLSIYFINPMGLNTSLFIMTSEGWVVSLLSAIILVVGSRIYANYYFSDQLAEKRVVIYGAGSAGMQLAGALGLSSEMKPIAFLDSNPALQNTFIGDLKVLHPNKLEKLVVKKRIDEVLIAMPSASQSSLRLLLKDIEKFSVKVRILPGLAALAQGKVSVSELKEVDITDLLGRVEVEADEELIDKNIKDKVVLVTGAGGSIGSEISRQALKNKPRKLIILDSNEYALYLVQQELCKDTSISVIPILGSVTNQRRIDEVIRAFGVQTIYHAAAFKHVPIVESNPFEAVNNNIFGTLRCVTAAIENSVETFVLISTDKAVRPTNIMGATKRFAELILQSLAHKIVNQGATTITMVRFGNVLGSSGSAIPLFQEQIKNGGPLTVTDPEVVRYFMSIPEAAELVIQAGAMAEGGDVFVLDMGEPVKILELAKRLIHLSGMEVKDNQNPNGDIEITFTGLRPGEKLFEELLIGDNVSSTQHKQIFKAKEEFLEWEELSVFMEKIVSAEGQSDHKMLRNILSSTVDGFNPDDDITDLVFMRNKER
jgi:FlaA1/EpsC-like NDP-sugar epimerase|tara:strand:+ start:3250 stop:5178 length:1929 start_codon:yes stop_codon:yes gene_type:complete